mgnify:CR=1 FL=1
MPCSTAESLQNDHTTGLGLTGTVVLSSSCRLLFIDRTAIDLLGTLDPDFSPPTGTGVLPPGLLTIAREIAAQHSASDSSPQSPIMRASRLLGPQSQPVRVEGFLVPCPQRQETRIVLVLSQCALGVL